MYNVISLYSQQVYQCVDEEYSVAQVIQDLCTSNSWNRKQFLNIYFMKEYHVTQCCHR